MRHDVPMAENVTLTTRSRLHQYTPQPRQAPKP
jgi:hypothetical protein